MHEAKTVGFLESYLDSWNHGRPDDLAAFFLPDGDLIAADGDHLRGARAIAEYYRNALSGPYGSLRLLAFKLRSSRQIAPGVSLVDGTWEVHGTAEAGATAQPLATPVGTFVIDTASADWKVVAARIYVPMKIA